MVPYRPCARGQRHGAGSLLICGPKNKKSGWASHLCHPPIQVQNRPGSCWLIVTPFPPPRTKRTGRVSAWKYFLIKHILKLTSSWLMRVMRSHWLKKKIPCFLFWTKAELCCSASFTIRYGRICAQHLGHIIAKRILWCIHSFPC